MYNQHHVAIFPNHSGHQDQTTRDRTLVLHVEPAHAETRQAKHDQNRLVRCKSENHYECSLYNAYESKQRAHTPLQHTQSVIAIWACKRNNIIPPGYGPRLGYCPMCPTMVKGPHANRKSTIYIPEAVKNQPN